MPIVSDVPAHLNVKDTIVFGLGADQLVRLMAGSSLEYGVCDPGQRTATRATRHDRWPADRHWSRLYCMVAFSDRIVAVGAQASALRSQPPSSAQVLG